MLQKSEILFKQALSYIPGGVNSPVRAFNGVGGTPFFVQKGEGAYLFDIDGNSYIDYVCSWGPLILGHAHPSVTASIKKAIDQGLGFGTPTPIEIEMAEVITKLVPSIEKIRMVNSGTEATMSAIRLARGYTGRNKIIKFRGCYHGHNDALLVKAGSGALTYGIPDSAGIPHDFVKHTLVSEYNDINEVKNLFEQYGDDIAAIIIEPIAGNMNFVLPREGFLQGLRQLCDQYHSVLIFDEVMTGFRVALGGAQSYYNIKPDLTTLGKIIGGGLPVGAFGGKKEIMDKLAPQGPVYQAGTLSGNPVALTAGLATLKLVMEPNFHLQLEKHTNQLLSGMQYLADKMEIPFFTQHLGGMFGFYFTEKRTLENYKDVQICNKEKFQKFFHLMLSLGVYFAPSAYEAGFISAAHTEEDIQSTLLAVEKAFSVLQQD